MADARQGDQCRVTEHRRGPDRHLHRHLGVLLAPDQVDRAADGGHGLAVPLGQQPDEDIAHHPVRRPVVGGPVPVPHRLHPVVAQQPHGVEPAGRPEGKGRAGSPAVAVEQGHPAQDHPLDSVGCQHGEPDCDPATEGVPDHHDPVGQRAVLEEREQLAGVLLAPPGLGRRRAGPEPRKVGADGGDRPGWIVALEDTGEVGMGSAPTMEGENGGDPDPQVPPNRRPPANDFSTGTPYR